MAQEKKPAPSPVAAAAAFAPASDVETDSSIRKPATCDEIVTAQKHYLAGELKDESGNPVTTPSELLTYARAHQWNVNGRLSLDIQIKIIESADPDVITGFLRFLPEADWDWAIAKVIEKYDYSSLSEADRGTAYQAVTVFLSTLLQNQDFLKINELPIGFLISRTVKYGSIEHARLAIQLCEHNPEALREGVQGFLDRSHRLTAKVLEEEFFELFADQQVALQKIDWWIAAINTFARWGSSNAPHIARLLVRGGYISPSTLAQARQLKPNHSGARFGQRLLQFYAHVLEADNLLDTAPTSQPLDKDTISTINMHLATARQICDILKKDHKFSDDALDVLSIDQGELNSRVAQRTAVIPLLAPHHP